MPIVLRLAQLKRILGIDIPVAEVRRILAALGGAEIRSSQAAVEIIPPTWRPDWAREIDLVEEVARIHGYDAIPENVHVPMAASHRSHWDRLLAKARAVLTSAGLDEAMTSSIVPAQWSEAFSPWTDASPLRCNTSILKGADQLRRSLIPSLLETRRLNEALGNPVVELFEIARIYLPVPGRLPVEQLTLGIVSGGDYYFLKGVVESLAAALKSPAQVQAAPAEQPLLDAARSSQLRMQGQLLGFLGEVAPAGLKRFGLRLPVAVAELRLEALESAAALIPQHVEQSPFPAIARDLNIVVDERVRWSDLAETVRHSGGQLLESIEFREIYRDPQTDGVGKKRLLFSISLRAPNRTLTGEQADELRQVVVTEIARRHGGKLLGQ
jgi:phenylalanyl-tRNA synthetase beta chain